MHFRVNTFYRPDVDLNFAHLQFDEGLNLSEKEVWKFEELLHFIMDGMYEWLFQLAQEQSELLNKYKKPAKTGDA